MALAKINVKTKRQDEFINITQQVKQEVSSQNVDKGLCTVYCPHTTAGITINEAADPSVVKDILMELDKRIPWRDGYSHMEGNSAAHIKSSIIGESVTVPIEKGSLALGTWQGIFFCEFDGPRSRTAYISIVKEQ
jgi:secondary thiamine-phosphate synthase enzyme